MMPIVRSLLPATAILLGLISAPAAADYPDRPVRVVVGFGPGSSADVSARVLSEELSGILGSGSLSRTGQAPAATRPRSGSSRRTQTATPCSWARWPT